MPDKIRAFVAIELPDEIRRSIGRVQAAVQETGLRGAWVRPENMHLTLKFLGDIRSSDIETISEAMTGACRSCEPFKLIVRGLGVFPNLQRPRVLWVGIAGQLDVLEMLQESLVQRLAACGYPEEKRRFHAHLTLARFNGPVAIRALLEAMRAEAAFETEPFAVRELNLFQSVLRPAGAVYSVLRRVGFAR